MKLNKLFNIDYPSTLIFSEQILDSNGINFVSSSSKNEGDVPRVKFNPNNKLYPQESITVPLKGSVLASFVQPSPFYVAHQIAVLIPKNPMLLSEKIFYCMCIRYNTYRYNYGRQADRTLKNMELPDKIPIFVNDTNIEKINSDIIELTSKIFQEC